MYVKSLICLFCAYTLSAACLIVDGMSDVALKDVHLNVVDVNKDSTMATLFAAVDDSLYERMKKTEWDGLRDGCLCTSGAIFVQSRHTDLMEQGWYFNWCGEPVSTVFYDNGIDNSKHLILEKNSILLNQIQSLIKLIQEMGCRSDFVYEFSEKELVPENAKKGIYVINIPIPDEDIRVPKKVRLLKVYYPDGKLFREIQFSQGVRNGYDKRYFPTGVTYIVHHYKNGLMDGNQVKYYGSGKKDFEVGYKNGKNVGIVKYYSEKNGSVTTEKIDEDTKFRW